MTLFFPCVPQCAIAIFLRLVDKSHSGQFQATFSIGERKGKLGFQDAIDLMQRFERKKKNGDKNLMDSSPFELGPDFFAVREKSPKRDATSIQSRLHFPSFPGVKLNGAQKFYASLQILYIFSIIG